MPDFLPLVFPVCVALRFLLILLWVLPRYTSNTSAFPSREGAMGERLRIAVQAPGRPPVSLSHHLLPLRLLLGKLFYFPPNA